jgi:transcriptional regulator NrdR family protein
MIRNVGLRCPNCGCTKLPVQPGRVTHVGSITIRIRQCRDCAARVETRESTVRMIRRT